MAARPLLVVGSGGLAREVLDALAALDTPPYEPVGFLDDAPEKLGLRLHDVPVVGPLEAIADHPDAHVLLCVGSARNPASRRKVHARLGLPPERYASIVHPSASIGRSCRLREGAIVLAGVVMTADVSLGEHVVMMPHTTLTHDDVLEPFVTVASGVRVAGGAHIGEAAYLGAGSMIREGIRVGREAIVGQGAVVVRDVPDGETWVGNPARPLVRAT